MPPLPKTMKGILIEKTGGTEVLQYRTDLPVPVPQAGELLVKNEYIGINYIDTYFRTGLYAVPLPAILGREASSHVISLGPPSSGTNQNPNAPSAESRFSPGDRVVWMGPSSYAEYSTCAAASAFLIPPDISSADACAAFLQGMTALSLTEEAHPVQRGEWVLVLAASGGVGGWLCQILRAKGAHTIATVGRREKAQAAEEAGAEIVLVENEEDDILQTVRDKTNGQGVSAVFDGVGKDTFDRSLACLRRKGSMVSFGNSSGAVPPISVLSLSSKNIKLTRPSLGNYIATPSELNHYGTELFQLLRDDNNTNNDPKNDPNGPNTDAKTKNEKKSQIKIKIHEIYPLKDIERAHQDIESRKTMGKLLLKP